MASPEYPADSPMRYGGHRVRGIFSPTCHGAEKVPHLRHPDQYWVAETFAPRAQHHPVNEHARETRHADMWSGLLANPDRGYLRGRLASLGARELADHMVHQPGWSVTSSKDPSRPVGNPLAFTLIATARVWGRSERPYGYLLRQFGCIGFTAQNGIIPDPLHDEALQAALYCNVMDEAEECPDRVVYVQNEAGPGADERLGYMEALAGLHGASVTRVLVGKRVASVALEGTCGGIAEALTKQLPYLAVNLAK